MSLYKSIVNKYSFIHKSFLRTFFFQGDFWEGDSKGQQMKNHSAYKDCVPGNQLPSTRDKTCENSGLFWNANHFPSSLPSYCFLSSQDEQLKPLIVEDLVLAGVAQ